MDSLPQGALVARCQQCGFPFLAGGVGEEFDHQPARIVMPGGLRIGMQNQSVSIEEAHATTDLQASQRAGSPVGSVDLRGVRVSECPNCGGVGAIDDGIYTFINDAIGILTRLTPEQAERVAHAFMRDDGTPATTEEIEANVAELPNRLRTAANKLIGAARKFGSFGQNVAAGLAAAWLYERLHHPATLTPAEIDRITRQIINSLNAHLPPPQSPPTR